MSTSPAFGQMLRFSAPAFAIHAFGLPLMVYLPAYLAETTTINIAVIGLAFMSVRIIDMSLDPLIGAMIDRTRTRWGAFRPWLAASIPLLILMVQGLFFAQHGLTRTMLWVWLSIGFIGYSVIVLSHLAWASTVGDTPETRTRVFAWWQIFASLGQLTVLAIPPLLLWLTSGTLVDAVHLIGAALLLIIPACVVLCLTSLPERPPSEARANSLLDYWNLLIQRRVWKILIADLALGLTVGVSNSVAIFFFTRTIGLSPGIATTLIMAQNVMALMGTPLLARLAIRLGNARSLTVAALIYAFAQLAYLLIPPGAVALAAITALTCGLFLPITTFMPRVMMAEIAESEREQTGINQSGLLYSMLNGTMKMAIGLSVGLAFSTLAFMGFEPTKPVTPGGAAALRYVMALAPAGLLILTALVMRTYRADQR